MIPATASDYERLVGPIMAPFVAVLVERVVEPGSRVLDVACGTGLAAREAARMAGPDGMVVGVDINPNMVETARALTGGAVGFVVGSALDLPWPEGSFDAVICQQGLQFFIDRSGRWRRWLGSERPVPGSRRRCGPPAGSRPSTRPRAGC